MADIYWLYEENGDFDDPAFWSNGKAPRAADNATIATTSRTLYTVWVTQNAMVKSLTLVDDIKNGHVYGATLALQSATLTAKTVSNAAEISLGGNSTLIVSGAIYNSYTIGTSSPDGGGELIRATKIVNTGVIAAQRLDVLTIDAPVVGKGGSIAVANDTIICESTVDSNLVFFETAEGPAGIELADSTSFTKSVTGFATAGQTSLDLDDIGFVNSDEASFSGTTSNGILTVTDGTHTAAIHLKGDYVGVTFIASSDGHGGTIVVANGDGNAKPPHAMISAMASFGAPPVHANHVVQAWSPRETLLAGPRAALV